jgi:histone H1/5
VSPILVRPVREQLEHDRVIRLLQAKYKRKFDVAINPGNVQAMPVGTGPAAWYPDLVLQSNERGHRLAGVVEVETVESVNHLEAMSQWAALAKLRAPFHLYIPLASIDSARRLCTDHHIPVAELWSYSAIGDQMRFSLVQRSAAAAAAAAKAAKAEKAAAEVKALQKAAASSPPRTSNKGSAAAALKAPAAKAPSAAVGASSARTANKNGTQAPVPAAARAAAGKGNGASSAKPAAKGARPKVAPAKPAARKAVVTASGSAKRR